MCLLRMNSTRPSGSRWNFSHYVSYLIVASKFMTMKQSFFFELTLLFDIIVSCFINCISLYKNSYVWGMLFCHSTAIILARGVPEKVQVQHLPHHIPYRPREWVEEAVQTLCFSETLYTSEYPMSSSWFSHLVTSPYSGHVGCPDALFHLLADVEQMLFHWNTLFLSFDTCMCVSCMFCILWNFLKS